MVLPRTYLAQEGAKFVATGEQWPRVRSVSYFFPHLFVGWSSIWKA